MWWTRRPGRSGCDFKEGCEVPPEGALPSSLLEGSGRGVNATLLLPSGTVTVPDPPYVALAVLIFAFVLIAGTLDASKRGLSGCRGGGCDGRTKEFVDRVDLSSEFVIIKS